MSEEFMYKWEDHQQLQKIDKQDIEPANYSLLLFLLFQPFAYFFLIVIFDHIICFLILNVWMEHFEKLIILVFMTQK